MATTIVAHTYKLKRGKEDAVLNANPLLLAGEPIVVFRNDGTTNVKIGDGETYYRDLPWIGSDQIYAAKSTTSFPNIGDPNVIYKSEVDAALFQWNSTKLRYEPLGGSPQIVQPVRAEDVIGLEEFVDARIDAKVDDQVSDAVIKEVEVLKTEFVTTETINVMEQTVTNITNNVTALESAVSDVTEQVETKADAVAVEQISNTVVVLEQAVEHKADTTRVEALETVIETKLDTEALEVVKVELAEQTTAQLKDFETVVDAKLEDKADDADITDLQEQIDNLSDGVIESVGTVSGGTAEDLLASLT